MSLRKKLMLALLPLLAALGVTGLVASVATDRLGESGRRILRENYRSVLAAQRMKESAERIDSASLALVVGQRQPSLEQIATHQQKFREELRVELDNVTEEGEADAGTELADLWSDYEAKLSKLRELPPVDLRAFYFDELQPAFYAVKDAADVILALNQDAMARKSDAADRMAKRARALVVAAALLGACLGVLASGVLTARLLRPLSVLTLTAQRIGEGDLAVRARVDERDEVGALAAEFNIMADRLEEYQRSSLGELLEAQRHAQSAIDSIPDPVAILKLDGVVVQVNEAASRLLEVGPDEPYRLARPELRPILERVHEHVALGKGPYTPKGLEEAVRIAGQDSERAYLPRATPVLAEDGTLTGTTIVLQDVTRLLRVDELRNNLVATVAHEFRTPLTSLRMAVHMCIEEAAGPLTEMQRDLLYTAREDCERLQAVIDELLDLSRIQAGHVEPKMQKLSVSRLLREVGEQHREAAERRSIVIETSVAPAVEVVEADPERLQVVFANLLSNAIRHSPDGGTIRLTAAPRDTGLRFEVVDQGPGVPPAFREQIFERSFQIPGAAKGAAGLGLFIARDFVQAHGGTIGVDGVEGGGSTFWFEMPGAVEHATG